MPTRDDDTYFGARHIPYPKKRDPNKPDLKCTMCGHEWASHNRCFVCPKCRIPYRPKYSHSHPLLKSNAKIPPKTPELEAFGLAVRHERVRKGLTQVELAEKFGIHRITIRRIEDGHAGASSMESKLIRERLRIWIEEGKPKHDKLNEIDAMFTEEGNG